MEDEIERCYNEIDRLRSEIERLRKDLEIWRRNGSDDMLRAEIERLKKEWVALYGVERMRFGAVRRLNAENERLRSTLSKYADPNYNGYNGGPEHAQRVLEGKS
jgi:hypothetical protein